MRKYGWIAVLVLAADRVTKLLAAKIPADGTVLVPGVLALRRTENRGMAFSLLSVHPRLLGVLSLLVIVAAFLLLRRKKFGGLAMTGLMMMLGGAVGNMIDRFWTGSVTDMIEVLFVRYPIFNVADTCLCVGCGLVIISLLFRKDEGREERNKNPEEEQ